MTDRDETFNLRLRDIPDHCDVMCVPGAGPNGEIEAGWIEILASPKGRAAVERIFPDGHFGWRDVPPIYFKDEHTDGLMGEYRDKGRVLSFPKGAPVPEKWANWRACCPNIPGIAKSLPRHRLRKHLLDARPVGDNTDSALAALMAFSACGIAYMPDWTEGEIRAAWISLAHDEIEMRICRGLGNKEPPETTYNTMPEIPAADPLDRFLGPAPAAPGSHTAARGLAQFNPEEPEPPRLVEALQRDNVVPLRPEVRFDKDGNIADAESAAVLERIARTGKSESVRTTFGHETKIVDGAALERASRVEPTFPSGLPCFELAPSVCCLDSVEERNEDLEGLKEFDFLFLPFPEVAIRVQIKDLMPDVFATGIDIRDGDDDDPATKDDFLTFTASGELSLVTAAAAGVETNSPMLFTKAALGDVCVFTSKGREYPWRLSDMESAAQRPPPPGFNWDMAKREYIVLMWDAITTLVRAANTMHGATITERNTRFHNKHKQSKPQFHGPLGSVYISMTRLAAPDPTTLPDYVPGTHASPKAHKRRAHIHTVSFGIGHREKRKERFPMMWINRVEGEPEPPARKYTVKR